MKTADYITREDLDHVLALLMPQNALICRVALHTGLRISDVLELRTEQLNQQRISVKERKTGKVRRIHLSHDLLTQVKSQAGKVWAFPGAQGAATGHKTRQAVWADIQRAKKALRMKETVSPHSLRKIYAVEQLKKTGDLRTVQRLLLHSDPAITALYAMADNLTAARLAASGRKKRR